MIWWILLIIFAISQCFIIWSMVNAPTMPDNFDIKEEDIWPLDQREGLDHDDEN